MDITPIIQQDFVVLDEDMMVSEMFGLLKKFEKRSGLVFHNKKYAGLVEKKKLLRSRVDASNTKIAKYIQPTPLLSEHADILQTAYTLASSNVDILPVESNKKIIGSVSSLDVALLATNLPEVSQLKVSDIKLSKPTKLKNEDAIAHAIDIMHDEHLDQVPVFSQGKLSGIVSYRDLMRKYLNWSPKRDISVKFNKEASSRAAQVDMPHLASLPVSSFSTNENLVTVKSKDSLKTVVQLMSKNKVSDALVMDGEDFKGVLTIKNILKKIGTIKIPAQFALQFIGLKELKEVSPYERDNLQKIASNEAFKLQRYVHNKFNLIIHIKEYTKGGEQRKYSVHLRVEFPGKILTSSEDDWDLGTALHQTFESVRNEAKSRFRSETNVDRIF